MKMHTSKTTISKICKMKIKDLKDLREILLIEEYEGKPLAVMLPYISYLTIQSIIQDSIESSKMSWTGIWFSNSGKFIEVITNENSYILQENGQRLVKCQIDKNGDIFFDNKPLGDFLTVLRRGTENFFNHQGKCREWPSADRTISQDN